MYQGGFDGMLDWKGGFIQMVSKDDHLSGFALMNKKMEWQCGTKIKSVWEGVIQFIPN